MQMRTRRVTPDWNRVAVAYLGVATALWLGMLFVAVIG